MKTLWNWESVSNNDGRIIGTCYSADAMAEMVKRLLDHPETKSIRISKVRQDYDPMVTPEQLFDLAGRKSQIIK